MLNRKFESFYQEPFEVGSNKERVACRIKDVNTGSVYEINRKDIVKLNSKSTASNLNEGESVGAHEAQQE